MNQKKDYLTPFSMGCSVIVMALLFVLAMAIWMRLTKNWSKPHQESPYISNRTTKAGYKQMVDFYRRHKDDHAKLATYLYKESAQCQ